MLSVVVHRGANQLVRSLNGDTNGTRTYCSCLLGHLKYYYLLKLRFTVSVVKSATTLSCG